MPKHPKQRFNQPKHRYQFRERKVTTVVNEEEVDISSTTPPRCCTYLYMEICTNQIPKEISEDVVEKEDLRWMKPKVVEIKFSYMNIEHYLFPKTFKMLHMLLKFDRVVWINTSALKRWDWVPVQDNQVNEYVEKLGEEHVKKNLLKLLENPYLNIEKKYFKEGNYYLDTYIKPNYKRRDNGNSYEGTWLYIKTMTILDQHNIIDQISRATGVSVEQYFCSYSYVGSKTKFLPMWFKRLHMLLQFKQKITIRGLNYFDEFNVFDEYSDCQHHIHWVPVWDEEEYIHKLRFELGEEANYFEFRYKPFFGKFVAPIYEQQYSHVFDSDYKGHVIKFLVKKPKSKGIHWRQYVKCRVTGKKTSKVSWEDLRNMSAGRHWYKRLLFIKHMVYCYGYNEYRHDLPKEIENNILSQLTFSFSLYDKIPQKFWRTYNNKKRTQH